MGREGGNVYMIEAKEENLFDEHEIVQELLSCFFRKKGEQLQERIGDDFKNLYPQEKIADLLNISIDQFRKKIYRRKPLTRDWLIAICAAYGLDDGETSEALSICDMPTLDDASNREQFIVNYLKEHKYKPVSVEDFNNALEEAGLPLLDIAYKKRKKNKHKNNDKETQFKELRHHVIMTYENQGDPYNSLVTKYLPNMECVARAFLEDKDSRRYTLEAHSDGDFLIYTEGDELPKVFKSIEPDNKFYRTFSELSLQVKKRKHELDAIEKDSKNYRGRYSGNVKNDSLHVFYEEFNYSMPERNEYYLMEYTEGKYILSVAGESMFMNEYLSDNEYASHFGNKPEIKRIIFSSLEDIETYYSQKNAHFYPSIKDSRLSAYKRLKKIVEEKRELIIVGKVHIQNFDYVWDEPWDVFSYYKIEKEFHCVYKNGEFETALESAVFKLTNGEEILIDFEDIKQAFELGIKNIDEVCRLKHKYGTIKKIYES